MYVRMVLLALVVIGVAGTGLTFWVLAQPEADVALERRVAAEFLGVAPDRVAATASAGRPGGDTPGVIPKQEATALPMWRWTLTCTTSPT